MKPENYRFVSPKQSAQHQWAAFGMSSRSEFSISTTTQVRNGTIAWETVITTVEGGQKAQHLIGTGTVSSPTGCFVVHPWGDKAKRLVEVGEEPSGLESFWDKSQKRKMQGLKSVGFTGL